MRATRRERGVLVRQTRRNRANRRTGFTLIELLTAIGIITLLVGIVGVVFSRVINKSERVATEQHLNSIKIALEQFKSDHGYYPPLLNDDPKPASEHYVPESQQSPSTRDAVESLRDSRYFSVHSLAVYLIGVGDLNPETDAEEDEHDGVAGPGFRSPGPDKSWGGAIERTTASDTHRPVKSGRTYGPYVDVASGDRLRQTTLDDFSRTEDGRFMNPQFDQQRNFYTLVDRWGKPIRYYRYWPTRSDAAGCKERSLARVPVELLSPGVFGSAMKEVCGTPSWDPASDRELFTAEYMLLSAGPDETFATTGDTGIDEGDSFVKGSLKSVPNYDSYELFQALIGGDDRAKARAETLVESISDNVRVSSQ